MPRVSVDILGEEKVFNLLADLPTAVQDAAMDDANKYLLDVLRIAPPPNYVTRAAAYGQTFFSDKQRRWFFANLNEGNISVPYNRTQALRQGWKRSGQGQSAKIINDRPGAEYVVGDKQSRHEAKVGWKKPDVVIRERETRLMEILEAGVRRVLRKLGA